MQSDRSISTSRMVALLAAHRALLHGPRGSNAVFDQAAITRIYRGLCDDASTPGKDRARPAIGSARRDEPRS